MISKESSDCLVGYSREIFFYVDIAIVCIAGTSDPSDVMIHDVF